MTTINLLVNNGCFASTVYGIVDALSCASYAAREIGANISFNTSIVSHDGEAVQSSSGYTVAVDHAFSDGMELDVVIVIPFISPAATDKDITEIMRPLGGTLAWLKQLSSSGKILTSSCTGSFLLAETGLLNGLKATTHWRAAATFRQRYPQVLLHEKDLITDNGLLMCGGGAASHLDLTLHLVRRFAGDEVASHCAHTLVVDPGRNLQTPYALMHYNTDHSDTVVGQAQQFIERNYQSQIEIQDIAENLHVSYRTLMRRFKVATGLPIGSYIQGVRIDQARNKLATSDLSLQSIPTAVGYEDFSSFARLFKNKTGLTMQTYRERFRP